jgi:hypothetical protein
VHAADGPIVLVEAVEEGAHAIVPHLDHPAVESCQDPWPPRVEAQALHPVALRLELSQHSASPLPPATAAAKPGPLLFGCGEEGRWWIWDRGGDVIYTRVQWTEGALDLGEGDLISLGAFSVGRRDGGRRMLELVDLSRWRRCTVVVSEQLGICFAVVPD